jgi:hypothetical protein
MFRRKTYYCIYRQRARDQEYCCKEFRTFNRIFAARRARRYAKDHGLSYPGTPVRGNCPQGSSACE